MLWDFARNLVINEILMIATPSVISRSCTLRQTSVQTTQKGKVPFFMSDILPWQGWICMRDGKQELWLALNFSVCLRSFYLQVQLILWYSNEKMSWWLPEGIVWAPITTFSGIFYYCPLRVNSWKCSTTLDMHDFYRKAQSIIILHVTPMTVSLGIMSNVSKDVWLSQIT